MYLRRNRVRCGESRRTYLSIAHNVWWARNGALKPQSRPVVVASFGLEDNVDVELARELVEVVDRCAPRFSSRRGEGREATMRTAAEIKRIEPFLKVLVSRKLGLAQHLPPHPERAAVLESLVRDKLAEPDGKLPEAELVSSLRSRFVE